MADARTAGAAASFSVLGAAMGYVLASAYLAYRSQGTFEDIDFLFLGRNLAALQQRAPRDFLASVGLIGACALLPLVLAGRALNERLTTFGSTAWQTWRELKGNGFLAPLGQGFILGKLGPPRSRRRFLVSRRFPHTMIVAPTGSGKGVGFVIPNLLTFMGSVVVLDVKGENFVQTARHRQAIGDKVIRFAPAEWSKDRGTHRYNPLQRIYEMDNPNQQLMELRRTAGLFLHADSDHARGLLDGGIDLFEACGMLAFQRGTPTLGEIYRLAAGGGDKKKAYAELAVEVQNEAARLKLQNLASINDKTLTSYLSLLMTSGLNQWSNPAIDAATASSDFSFRDIRRSPHAIYLDVGLGMLDSLAPLVRLFFSDLIASLQSNEPGPDEPWRVMILMDEFDQIGRVPIVAESIKTLRSYGGHLAIISQSIPGIDDIYGENTRLSLQAGAGVKLYMTPADAKTSRELSEALGTRTRRVVTKSRPLGHSALSARTLTERSEEAPLMSEDEVRTMDPDQVVIVTRGQAPIRARRIEWFNDPVLKAIHAEQKGEWPYPPPAGSEPAPARPAQLAATPGAEPENRAPEPTSHSEATAPKPATAAPKLVVSARRSPLLRARAIAVVQPLPTVVRPEDAEAIRRAVRRMMPLLEASQPPTPETVLPATSPRRARLARARTVTLVQPFAAGGRPEDAASLRDAMAQVIRLRDVVPPDVGASG